ncbi:hypothetical protein B0H34DRAFT_205436 [Crassisporium funariophilum]|nr:hypothetical protein B0H34DRAFT_205436 [Crassisporium funariophilum]
MCSKRWQYCQRIGQLAKSSVKNWPPQLCAIFQSLLVKSLRTFGSRYSTYKRLTCYSYERLSPQKHLPWSDLDFARHLWVASEASKFKRVWRQFGGLHLAYIRSWLSRSLSISNCERCWVQFPMCPFVFDPNHFTTVAVENDGNEIFVLIG